MAKYAGKKVNNFFKNDRNIPDCKPFQEGRIDCSYCGGDGLITGAVVLTESGWQDVSQISAGDLIMTVENDFQPVVAIVGKKIWVDPGDCPTCVCPLFIPAKVLGNDTVQLLQAETMVVISAFFRDHSHGFPLLVQANDLENLEGIRRIQPENSSSQFQLQFESRQIVKLNGGAEVLAQGMAP